MAGSTHQQAEALVARVAEECAGGGAFGSMSISIYDTAWVSMVQKPDGTWLSPESFDFLLNHQLPNGSRESYASAVDGILNTAAALLALKKRLSLFPENASYADRCLRAESALTQMLLDWDVESCDHVGFEMLVTQHVSLLQEQGIQLSFPHMDALQALRDAKLSKLPPSSVHNSTSTLYHSLEALIGHIDFDNVRRWRDADGSMMGSPSSTAAYLMHCSTWDDQAEAYLKNVLRCGAGSGSGSVPCAWPTPVFEVTWVVTTLKHAGIKIPESEARTIKDFIDQCLISRRGVLGFAPWSFPDADDTAQSITAVSILGGSVAVDGLLEMFETQTHFRTYPGERNPSFSADTNVLICLLSLDDPMPFIEQIVKTITFLTAQVFEGQVNEKWASFPLRASKFISSEAILTFRSKAPQRLLLGDALL